MFNESEHCRGICTRPAVWKDSLPHGGRPWSFAGRPNRAPNVSCKGPAVESTRSAYRRDIGRAHWPSLDRWRDVSYAELMTCPDLTREDIRACVAFAVDCERRLVRSADSEAGPRKVIWLALGNCAASQIGRRLRSHRDEIEGFATGPDTTQLVIEPGQGAGMSCGTPSRLPT